MHHICGVSSFISITVSLTPFMFLSYFHLPGCPSIFLKCSFLSLCLDLLSLGQILLELSLRILLNFFSISCLRSVLFYFSLFKKYQWSTSWISDSRWFSYLQILVAFHRPGLMVSKICSSRAPSAVHIVRAVSFLDGFFQMFNGGKVCGFLHGGGGGGGGR